MDAAEVKADKRNDAVISMMINVHPGHLEDNQG